MLGQGGADYPKPPIFGGLRPLAPRSQIFWIDPLFKEWLAFLNYVLTLFQRSNLYVIITPPKRATVRKTCASRYIEGVPLSLQYIVNVILAEFQVGPILDPCSPPMGHEAWSLLIFHAGTL